MNKQEIESRNNLAERIIAELDAVIRQSEALQTFSIIAAYGDTLDRNVSPVHFVPIEHCLALESWCASLVFTHSQERILKLRKETLLKRDLHMINALNTYLNAALLIQPDVSTFWNIKRELLPLLDFAAEMHFSKLVLSHKPKSSTCYSYRECVIQHQQSCDEQFDCLPAIRAELSVIEKAVECPNNYHAWNHRIWCIKYLLDAVECENILFEEFHYSRTFVTSHVSEHSSFYYRQYIIQLFKTQLRYPCKELISLTNAFNVGDCPAIYSLINNQYLQAFCVEQVAMFNQFICLLIHELMNVCRELNVCFYGHEAIWYHRRFVFHALFTLLYAIHGLSLDDFRLRLPNDSSPLIAAKTKQDCDDNCRRLLIQGVEKSTLFTNLLIYERDFMHLLSEKNANSSLELKFIERHKCWLKHFVNLDLNSSIALSDNEKLFNL